MKDHNHPCQDDDSKTGQNNEQHLLVHSGHPADQTAIRHHKNPSPQSQLGDGFFEFIQF